MKKIVLGFVAIGLFTLVSCRIFKNNAITDGEGNKYNSVAFGTQIWMVENLRTTKYSDGTPIPNVTDNTQWYKVSTGAWSHYDNDSQNDSLYGKLYNWNAVKTEKLCPTGWHVPTDEDWTILNDYLAANGHNESEGTALKATSGWKNRKDGTSGNGTDDYGWLGLPGGYRWKKGSFNDLGSIGLWWSSSQRTGGSAWRYSLTNGRDINGRDILDRSDRHMKTGFSVRCLCDKNYFGI